LLTLDWEHKIGSWLVCEGGGASVAMQLAAGHAQVMAGAGGAFLDIHNNRCWHAAIEGLMSSG